MFTQWTSLIIEVEGSSNASFSESKILSNIFIFSVVSTDTTKTNRSRYDNPLRTNS